MRIARKVRRTFTLSPENLAYIEEQTRQRKLSSHSAFLDELLLEKTREQKLATLDANVRSYYDKLTDEETNEQRLWGELAEPTLLLTEEETPYDEPPTRRDLVHQASNRPARKRKASGRSRVRQRPK